MTCPRCNQELKQNARFCQSCGMQVSDMNYHRSNQEIDDCKRELNELLQRASELSNKIDMLSAQQLIPKETEPLPQSFTSKTEEIKTINPPLKSSEPEHVCEPSPIAEYTPEKKIIKRKNRDLEENIGKNLFAIVASVLVLIGISVFISTIYEYIPTVIKIMAIYLFGFAMVGVGVTAYAKGKNNFWLGLASCGTAELLISIITSYTYFKIISLPVTYLLILLWVVGTFALTKIKPVLFKTIGYIGFLLSMFLGLSLLERNDGFMLIMLFVSYVGITCLFAITHKEQSKLNTILLYISTLFSFAFFIDRFFLSKTALEPVDLKIFIALAVVTFNLIHRLRYKDLYKSFVVYSGASIAMIAICLSNLNPILLHLIIAGVSFALWFIHLKTVGPNQINLLYEALVTLPILITLSDISNSYLAALFLTIPIVGLTILYKNKKDYGSAIFALIAFTNILSLDLPTLLLCTIFLIVACGLFILLRNETKNGLVIKNIWYCWVIYAIVMSFQEIDHAANLAGYKIDNLCATLSFVVLVSINLFRTFKTAFDKIKGMKADTESIFLYIINGILFLCGLFLISDNSLTVIEEILAILAHLAIITFTLMHSVKTNWENQFVTMIHCIKFTFYIWFLTQVHDVSNILINIIVLTLAIGSIILGFAKNSKPARIYGLALSLLSSVTLVLFTVSFDSTLQVAGGTILCGLLCFAISFIYSKAEKALSAYKQEDADNEDTIDTIQNTN